MDLNKELENASEEMKEVLKEYYQFQQRVEQISQQLQQQMKQLENKVTEKQSVLNFLNDKVDGKDAVDLEKLVEEVEQELQEG